MMETLAFYLFGGVTLGSAVMVAATPDLMRAAVWLLACLGGVAGLYMNLAADFLAGTQLLVYVGGVVVLLMFGVMMTRRADGTDDSPEPPLREKLAAGAVALSVLAVMAVAISSNDWSAAAERSGEARRAAETGAGFGITGEGAAARHKTPAEARDVNPPPERPMANVRDVGWALLADGQFLLPFYLAGVHLLVVMIGAAWLARRPSPPAPSPVSAEEPSR
jgi:NADH:ubiquinone oxidoreductase subunit 6 (subunit J)